MSGYDIHNGLNYVRLLNPAADAAGRTGDWVSLKNAIRAEIVVTITQGNAATILLTPLQASAVAGTGSKVLTVAVPIKVTLDCAATSVPAEQTKAVNYTTTADVAEKIVRFFVDPATLDIANGFDCITLSTGASNAANITQAMIIIEPRYVDSSINDITD